MMLLLLITLALSYDPCQTNNGQATSCSGGASVSKTASSVEDCESQASALNTKRLGQGKTGTPYFAFKASTGACKVKECSSGAFVSDTSSFLLYTIGGDPNGACPAGTESSASCTNAPAGTRCVDDDNCQNGLHCCENYKVCASGSGTSGALTAVQTNGVWYKWGGSDWNVAITSWNGWACSTTIEMSVAVSQTSCDGMPLWAYGMFALLTLNPIILLWTRREKGDAYKNLLDEE